MRVYERAEIAQKQDLTNFLDFGYIPPAKVKKTKRTNRKYIDKHLKKPVNDLFMAICYVGSFDMNNYPEDYISEGFMNVYSRATVALDVLGTLENKLDKSTFYFFAYTFQRVRGICVNYFCGSPKKRSCNWKGDVTFAMTQMVTHLARTLLIDDIEDYFKDVKEKQGEPHYRGWVFSDDPEKARENFKYEYRY